MFRSSKPLVAVCVAALSLAGGFLQAAEEPKVSRAMEKPLKACNDSYQAKKFDDAIAKCKEATSLPNRSAYDNFVINQILAVSYAQTKRYTEAYPVLKEVVESPYVDRKSKDVFILTLGQIAFGAKDYPAAIDWAQKAIADGQDNADTRGMIANSYYAQKKFKECTTAAQDVVGRAEKAGQRPTENSLQMLFACQSNSNDMSGQGRTIEKLVTYYPKPDYWLNAMITLIQSAQSAHDDRLLLQVYRLQADVGTMKRNDQYGEMAKLAMEQGYPGEAVSVLDQAMAKNVFTDAREKAQYGRLLEAAKKGLEQEKLDVAKSEQEAMKSANGDLLIAVGASYLFNLGDATKAVTLIQQGITKGVAKIPVYDAYVTLGLAQAKAKNAAEGDKAFGKVDKNDNYERLAKLWSLRVK